MSVLKSFVIAFAMYSRIPVPQFEWKERDMRYVICFFPFVGVVIGAVTMLWAYVCAHFSVGKPAFTLVGFAMPLLISGGIHVDGFMDTMDAFHSYRKREEKLQILKDAHIGAFSVICLVTYGLLFVGAYSELTVRKQIFLLACGYYLARILSGLGVVTLRCAKKDGLLYLFANRAHKIAVRTALAVQLIVCGAMMILFGGWMGAAALLGAVLTFFYYRHVAYRELGGITGDTAGYFLTLCEGVMVALLAVCGWIGV